MSSKGRLIRRRLLAIATAFAAAATGILTTATPAQAGGDPLKFGLAQYVASDVFINWWYSHHDWPPPGEDDDEWWYCPDGVVAVEFATSPELSVANEKAMTINLGGGIVLLDRAAHTTDPAARAKLRGEAMGAFSTAARNAGRSSVSVGEEGCGNAEKNWWRKFFGQPPPHWQWLREAGRDLASGITLIQRGSPAEAQRAFDEAYQQIATQTVVG